MRVRMIGAIAGSCLLVAVAGCDADPPKAEPLTSERVNSAHEPGPKTAKSAVAPTSEEEAQKATAAADNDAPTPQEPGSPSRPVAPGSAPATSVSLNRTADMQKVAEAALRPSAAAMPSEAKQRTVPNKRTVQNKTVRGTAVSEEAFSAHLQATGPFTVGNPAQVTVVLTAKSPFKCNDKYPYKFKTLGGETVRGAQVGKRTTTLRVPFTPNQAGQQSVGGTLHFSVCTEDQCLIKRAKLSVGVTAS